MSLAVKLEIFRSVLTGIAEEMGARLQRSAYSANIKERRDYSCALFDRQGRLAGQAAHIPVHLGSMPLLIQQIVKTYDFEPGDVIIANDPFAGGTHLPDITLVEPVFYEKRLWGFAASRAHHSDVGGKSAGSMPDSTRIFEEGIIIPPLFLKKRGALNRELLKLITHNTRTPETRMGDFYSQLASLETARKRIYWKIETYGFDEAMFLMEKLLEYSETLTKDALGKLPEGRVEAEDYLENDRTGSDVPIHVSIELRNKQAFIDFTGTAPQQDANFNATYPVTCAAVYYVFRCLLGDHIPTNSGCFAPIHIKAPAGCLVNAGRPYAVSAGNVETSQRIVDVLLLALSRILPHRIPSASCGSMNNIAIGGCIPGTDEIFAYYETVAGGMGAGPCTDGESAVHTHMTNTRNTPIEALETFFPFTVNRYEIRKNSGGSGRRRGGDGIIREYGFNQPAQVSIVSERRRIRPYGLAGGEAGKAGRNLYRKKGEAESKILPGKITLEVEKGDLLTLETPGGGGWGQSSSRS